MDWHNIKQYIDNNADNTTEDISWQAEVFKDLAENFSVIPIRNGVYSGATQEEIAAEKKKHDLKAPEIEVWQAFCQQRSTGVPTGDKIGIATGPASNLLVLDVDNLDAFTLYCQNNGIDMEMHTLTVQSREGRFHLYFQYPNDGQRYPSRCFKPDGFDIRGDGGYIIGPGSIHPETRTIYTIIAADPIAPAPEWLRNVSLYRTPTAPAPTPMEASGSFAPPPGMTYMPAVPERTQFLLDTAFPQGERSEAVMTAVNSLLCLGIPPEQVKALVLASPVGEVARQKGPQWLDRTLVSGQQFVAPFLVAQQAKAKRPKLNMANELYATMLEHEYYSHEREYFARVTMPSGAVRLINITDDAFEGHIFNRQAAKTGQTGNANDMKTAKKRLAAHVSENAKPIKKICRFGVYGEGLLLNLALPSGECLSITKAGYEVVPPPLVLMDGKDTLLPLDNIKLGCTGLAATNEMLDLLDVNKPHDRHYLSMTCVSFLFEEVSTPFVLITGEQGSGKTTLAAALKGIFDPMPRHEDGGSALPENVLELALTLNQQGVALIDNFSRLSQKTQNALCQAFSNGYFPTRKYYTNDVLLKIPLKCPVLLTCLDIPGNLQDDLASRMAFFTMKRRTQRRAETDLKTALDNLYPAVRGELCWLASEILKHMDQYTPLNMKRHADFDKLGQAYFASIGNEDPTAAYREVMQARLYDDSSARLKTNGCLGEFVSLVRENGYMTFTMAELHLRLTSNPTPTNVPLNPAALGKYLQGQKPTLNNLGIVLLEGGKLPHGRVYLAAVEKKLLAVGGKDALKVLENQPSIITNAHSAAPDKLEEVLKACLSPITIEAEPEPEPQAPQPPPESSKPAPTVKKKPSYNPFRDQ